MRSGKSCFESVVFQRALRRWWPLGLALCAALLYQCLGAIQSALPVRYENVTEAVLSQALRSPLPAVFACAGAMLACRYLHSLRHAAFMAALPVRREAVFLSQGAAALLILLSAEILCALLAPIFAGAAALLYPVMGRWLCVTAALTAAYFGFASLCGVLTGSTLALPAFYALGLYAAVALEVSVRNMAQFLIFGLGSQQWKLTVLSPVYYLRRFNYALLWSEITETDPLTGIPLGYITHFEGRGAVIGYLAAGCLCVALALALLKKRPAEAAGDVIAVRLLRGVFRAGAALAGGCGGGLLLLRTVFGYSGYYAETGSGPKVALLFFVVLLGGFVGWFGAEMLLRKSLRVFDRHWAGYGIYAAAVLLLVLGCKLDLFGVERAVPAREKIGFATLSCYEVGVNEIRFEEPENIAALRELHRTVVENKELFEQDSGIRYATAGNGYYNPYGYHPGGTLVLRYYDRGGRLLMTREYAAPAGDMAWASNGNAFSTGGTANPAMPQLEALANTPEAVAQRYEPWIPVQPNNPNWASIYYISQDALAYYRLTDLMTLNGRETYELYTQAIEPDLRDSSMGYVRLRPRDMQTLPEPGNVTINLCVNDESGEQWWFFGRVTPDAGRTIRWLANHGVELDKGAMYTPPEGDVAPDDEEW